jgi:hypothetical protein
MAQVASLQPVNTLLHLMKSCQVISQLRAELQHFVETFAASYHTGSMWQCWIVTWWVSLFHDGLGKAKNKQHSD